MRTYIVEFWYNTDMRASLTVDALSTSQAVYAAEVKGARMSSIRDWCDNGPEFHITIKHVAEAARIHQAPSATAGDCRAGERVKIVVDCQRKCAYILAMETKSHPKIRYEIEWPMTEPRDGAGDLDVDNIEWECEYKNSKGEADAFAKKALLRSPMRLAYVTREVYTGNGDPQDDERGWERQGATREEFTTLD